VLRRATISALVIVATAAAAAVYLGRDTAQIETPDQASKSEPQLDSGGLAQENTRSGALLPVDATVGLVPPTAAVEKAADKSKPSQTAEIIASLARDLKLSEAEVMRRLEVQDRLLAVSENLNSAYPTQIVASRIDWNTDRLVVTVNDESAATSVRQTGADVRVVDANTVERMQGMLAELNRDGGPAGTSWSADLENGVFVIGVDSEPMDAAARTLVERVRAAGLDVRVELLGSARTAQGFIGVPGGTPYLIKRGSSGSSPIGKCALGFNVLRPSDPNIAYSITAGHCAPSFGGDVALFSDNNPTFTTNLKVGRINSGDRFFPGNDFAAVRFDPFSGNRIGYFLAFGVHEPSAIFKFVSKTPLPLNSPTGIMVCLGLVPFNGFASAGYNCGVTIANNMSFVDADGNTISNNISSTACGRQGDSGGPLIRKPVTSSPFEIVQGVGIFSGFISAVRDTSTGVVTPVNCGDARYRSYHQPLVTALNRLGMQLPDTLQFVGIVP